MSCLKKIKNSESIIKQDFHSSYSIIFTWVKSRKNVERCIISIWLTCPSPASGQEKTYWSWKTMLKATSLIILSSTLPRRDSPSLQEAERRVWDHQNITARHGILCNEPTHPHWPKNTTSQVTFINTGVSVHRFMSLESTIPSCIAKPYIGLPYILKKKKKKKNFHGFSGC